MFLLSVYSSSNSLRTLILKETNRHFSFSVFLFCCHILPILFLGKRSADFLFIWNQAFSGWNCLFCLQAERWKHFYPSMNKEDSVFIYTSEHCIIWAFNLFFFFSWKKFFLNQTIPASEFSSLRRFEYFRTLLYLFLYTELSQKPIVIRVKFQLIFTPGCDTK